MNTFASQQQRNNNDQRNSLVGQLCKSIVLGSSSGSSDVGGTKESLLQAMSEHILGSSMSPIVNLDGGNVNLVLELCSKRLSPSAAGRFLPLASAFLNSTAPGSPVLVMGAEKYTRKLPLLYFLLRVAEKKSNALSSQSLLGMIKKPEELVDTRVAGKVNSRIEGFLKQSHESQSASQNARESQRENSFASSHTPSHYQSIQPQQQHIPANAWELFEDVKRKDLGGVGEELLVRDLIFVLQGLEGTYLRYSGEGYAISDRLPTVARPLRNLVAKLGQIGADFRFLQRAVSSATSSSSSSSAGGVIKQSFCRAMAQELAEYLKLVAFLESSLSSNGTEEVTLKKVVFWFHEAGLLLGLLKEIVIASEGLKGGALLSLLERHRLHGNERVRTVLSRLLEAMLIPFAEMLGGWLADGSVSDAFGEFFISKASNAPAYPDWEADGAQLWSRLFTLRPELPAFISEETAKRALIGGKTRLFIQAYRHSLPEHLRYLGSSLSATANSSHSSLAEDVEMNKAESESIGTRDALLLQLESNINRAYKYACKQVKRILIDDCRLVDQLRCIREYMLLGKGDFSLCLMDSLAEALERPASTLFRHNLVGILEGAIRGCSRPAYAQDWILNCLDVRLASQSAATTATGNSGWDAFALDYRLNFPLNCVIDAEGMAEYARLSRHLWSLKRLEYALNRSWQQMRRVKNRDLSGKRLELLAYEMISFVRAAVAWSFEVITEEAGVFEGALNDLLSKNDGLDLDEVIRVHRAYLLALKTKLRLWSSSLLRGKTAALSATILRFCCLPVGAGDVASIARHWQAEVDDLLMSVEREAGGAGSPAAQAILMKLDYSEYHRRRNGFDHKKYA